MLTNRGPDLFLRHISLLFSVFISNDFMTCFLNGKFQLKVYKCCVGSVSTIENELAFSSKYVELFRVVPFINRV